MGYDSSSDDDDDDDNENNNNEPEQQEKIPHVDDDATSYAASHDASYFVAEEVQGGEEEEEHQHCITTAGFPKIALFSNDGDNKNNNKHIIKDGKKQHHTECVTTSCNSAMNHQRKIDNENTDCSSIDCGKTQISNPALTKEPFRKKTALMTSSPTRKTKVSATMTTINSNVVTTVVAVPVVVEEENHHPVVTTSLAIEQ